MLIFFRCVAEAIIAKGPRGLMDMLPGGGFAYDVAENTLERYRQRCREPEMRAEVEQLAQASVSEARSVAEQVVRDVSGVPNELALPLVQFLASVPQAVRQSLKRPDDPSGRSVGSAFVLRNVDDVARLLPPRPPRFQTGTTPASLHGWILEELLGIGGFGEVWRARHPRFGNLRAAVKFAQDLTASERDLLHEGQLIDRLLAQGRHPGIVPLQDAALETDTPWLRYELVDGGDLADEIRAWQNLSAHERVRRTVLSLTDLAGTVGYFHRLDPPIVHRDLKPANILLDRAVARLHGSSPLDFVPRVADFGIGGVASRRSLEGEARRTTTRGGRLLSYLRGSHTPLYASPQQRDGADPDPRDDVHALGVIGYQMLTGNLSAGTGPDFDQDLEEAGASAFVIAALRRCVAQKAERRWKDAGELAEQLRRSSGTSAQTVEAPRVDAGRQAAQLERWRQCDEPRRWLLQRGGRWTEDDVALLQLDLQRSGSGAVAIADIAEVLTGLMQEYGARLDADLEGYNEALKRDRVTAWLEDQAPAHLARWQSAARAGWPAACVFLGICHKRGIGVDQDAVRAVELFRKAAEQGSAAGQNCLAWHYQHGEGVEQDCEQAAQWYQKAARQDNVSAQAALGWICQHGKGLPRNVEQALEWYRRAALGGAVWGQYYLGLLYRTGDGVPQDAARAREWFQKSAELGLADAQNELALLYRNGWGFAVDNAKALEWFTRAAQQGHAAAAANIGWMYHNGLGVPQDYVKAMEWYRKAAHKGNVAAQANIAWLYQEGLGVEQDHVKAREWYEKAARQGLASAQCSLGWLLQNGFGGPADQAGALELYEKAAQGGVAAAARNIGLMYRDGQGVGRDVAAAIEWFRKAADQGHADAQFDLGWIYDTGQGVPQDRARALQWYLKAAQQGVAGAARNLGLLYRDGLGVPRDYAQAVEWFTKAAQKGHADALNDLGWMYHNGWGVPQDYARAMQWYQKAAQQNHAYAFGNIGWLYENGKGVSQDHDRAREWYLKAADRGNAASQHNLGRLYEYGLGVGRDLNRAMQWYRKAAALGYADAQQAVRRLEGR